MTKKNTQELTNGRGAPLANRNAVRHGLRGSGLPSGCERIGRECNKFRRAIEDQVIAARGEISLIDASFICTAFRAERHCQLSQTWLAKEAVSMTPADRLHYSREVVRASESRDKALAALRLPQRPDADPWATITVEPESVSVSDSNVTESKQEAHSDDKKSD